jgi:hypothetical protein
MSRTSRTLALAAVTAAVAGAVTALAAVTDPNDVAGKLDLKTVGGTEHQGLVTLSVSTYGPWSKANLPASGSANRLVVLIDTNGNDTADYRARIVRSGSALVALLSGRGSQFEPIPVRKVGNRARFTFPDDVLEPSASNVRVAAHSVYKGGACATACVDRAPNAGFATVAHP